MAARLNNVDRPKCPDHVGRRVWMDSASDAAGLDPATGRPRRPDGPRSDAYRSIAGLVVADLPDLLAIWDFEKSKAAGLDPHTTKASVVKRAFWACPVHPSHRWDATIKDKGTFPVGCPFCQDRRACPTNSVAALYPDVAKEWHPTKNGLTADDFLRGANKVVWWKLCAKRGHVWEARVNARTIYGQGCPGCAKSAQAVRERATTARAATGATANSPPSPASRLPSRHRRRRRLIWLGTTCPSDPLACRCGQTARASTASRAARSCRGCGARSEADAARARLVLVP